MAKTQNKYGKLWSRSELILALYVYCQIPFNHCHKSNNEVNRLAEKLGRTPSSVARKLGNFGSFDPLLAARGIRGLTHTGKRDREVWDEYYGHWDKLVADANDVLSQDEFTIESQAAVDVQENVLSEPIGPTSEFRVVMTRRFQSFFRRAVLSSYQNSCCVCGLGLTSLLIASHIIPWAENEESRVDPRNGLCLCALHDKAFDSGLISVDGNLVIHLSSIIKLSNDLPIEKFFFEYEAQKIVLPNRFAPEPNFLSWHFSNRYIP